MHPDQEITHLVSVHKKNALHILFACINIEMTRKMIENVKKKGEETRILEKKILNIRKSMKNMMLEFKKSGKKIKSTMKKTNLILKEVPAISTMSEEFKNSSYLPENVKSEIKIFIIEKDRFF